MKGKKVTSEIKYQLEISRDELLALFMAHKDREYHIIVGLAENYGESFSENWDLKKDSDLSISIEDLLFHE